MKGWGSNLGADLRARKGALLGQIKTLDDLADGTGLSPDDWIRRYYLDAELMGIFSSDELFWQRRGGQNWLLKGDANTTYFQAIANGRRRKCVIPFLRDGDALLENPEDISSHIYSFYKELFSADMWGGSSLCEDFWPLADQAGNGRPKYHMVKWAYIFLPKDRGGLGIPASRGMNVALMLRWVWRILQGDGGLWLQLIEAKYLRGRPLLACSLANGLQFWKSIQSIKHEIRLGLRISVGDGFGTQFWLDPWLEGELLRFRFPRLFAICVDRVVLVSAAALEGGWHVAFRRPLGPIEVLD
ncbi:ABC transporter G family member 37 [Hordeum vulgare]|nr:ABC transporter G family member 37 [Hordeum vulgare]